MVLSLKEKDCLLKNDSHEFIENLKYPNFFFTLLDKEDVYNEISLYMLYILLIEFISIYNPDCLYLQHKNSISKKSKREQPLTHLQFLCLPVTNLNWEENPQKEYDLFLLKDYEVPNYPSFKIKINVNKDLLKNDVYGVSHSIQHHFYTKEDFYFFLNSMILLYYDFVSLIEQLNEKSNN